MFLDFNNLEIEKKLDSYEKELFNMDDNDLCFLDLCKKSKVVSERKYRAQYVHAHFISVIDTEKMVYQFEIVKKNITNTILWHNMEDLLLW